MINIDGQGNITCTVNDTILLNYELTNYKDKLTNKDLITLYLKINGESQRFNFTPQNNIAKISLIADKVGEGSYTIEVNKEDGRIETTNYASIKVYDRY